MKNSITVKRIICFLLAVLMLFAAAGCKEKKKRKKKVIIRDKVVIKNDKDDSNSDDSSGDGAIIDDTDVRDMRELLEPEVIPETIPYDEIHKENFVPEFDYKNVDFNGNFADYVIVYSAAKDKNGAATNSRVLAEKLATFFKDNDKVDIPVYEETKNAAEISGKKLILVGDTVHHKSSLSETEFAVNLKGDNIVFEGGHQVMVEKAVDWFRTVKRESGKIATLTGKTDEFASTVTVDGQKYVYVWGDEFDGEELVDRTKWKIGTHMPQWSDVEYLNNNKDVCYVENGRLRLTAIRYLSEKSGDIGYASCGSYDTEDTMAFRNGYLEFDVKFSYTKGILPPLWMMSNPEVGLQIPREQYEIAWSIEFDIFETFANGDQWDVSIHKYYKPYDVTVNGVNYNNGIKMVNVNSAGEDDKITMFQGEDISAKFTDQKRYLDGWASWGFITSWRNFYDQTENAKQMYKFTGDELNELNDTYHKYGMIYNEKGYKMYIDGKMWLEREWDTAYDGVDCNNNNGWGYNMYYYLIMNQHPYTPASENNGFAPELHVNNPDLPISSWIDNVRLYQLPNSIEVETPALRN